MRKIKTLMKQWAHQNAKDAVVKKANLKKMQKWWCISRDSANVKFILWCNKADQKSILNQFFKQHQRKKSVSDIQVYQITFNWKAIFDAKLAKRIENWIQWKVQDISESNVLIIFENSNQWRITIERKYTVIKSYQREN